ncbi:MAG: hypothetical protein LBB94_09670 [Clostridiales bacterium]|nr:hypothetical protein [Clostridiales bacterium]
MDKRVITNNIKKISTLKTKSIFIIGLSEDCFQAGEVLRELGYDIYAYASDDIIVVNKNNKTNIIFAEKWFSGDIKSVIKIVEFDSAVTTRNSVYLTSSDHYENKLKAGGYVKDVDYFRINQNAEVRK